MGWIITCPNPKCLHRADLNEFLHSLAGECWCPVCDTAFLFEPEDEDEDESEDDDAET